VQGLISEEKKKICDLQRARKNVTESEGEHAHVFKCNDKKYNARKRERERASILKYTKIYIYTNYSGIFDQACVMNFVTSFARTLSLSDLSR
jgi:hypothetical protein